MFGISNKWKDIKLGQENQIWDDLDMNLKNVNDTRA